MSDAPSQEPTNGQQEDRPVGIGGRMAKGAAWMVALRLTVGGIGLVSMLVLARLLMPQDFGLVALATMLMGLLDVMSEFSFDVALIQNQRAGRAHYDTAWTLSVIRGAVIAILLALLAVPTALFFAEPRVESLVYWLAFAAFVEGFQNIGVVEFRKELRFHKEFTFLAAKKLGAFVVTVTLAILWRDYWALIAGIVTSKCLGVGLSYGMHGYRPRPSLAAWRELFRFTKWLLASNFLSFVNQRSDTLIIGKLLGASSLGIYAIAYEISTLATTELVAPIRRAIFPGYAKLAADPESLRKVFLDTFSIIVLLAAPVAAGIRVTADPMVRVLLGERWVETIPLIEVLAIYGLIEICSANGGPYLIAIGRPQIIAYLQVLWVLILVPLALLGANRAGLYGVAWAVTGTGAAMVLLYLGFVARQLGLPLIRFGATIWRASAATALMVTVVELLKRALPPTESVGVLGGQLASFVAVGVVAYCVGVYALWILSGAPRSAEWYMMEFARSRLGVAPTVGH